MEHDDDIELVGFHEEVDDDINEKLKHLVDSHDRLEKIFLETITKNKKVRSEIDSEVGSMIDVANDVKLIMESIFLPQSSTSSIPCLRDLRWKLIRVVYLSNLIRRRAMIKWYENRVVDRLNRFWREVTTTTTTSDENVEKKNLSIEMFLSMMKDLSIEEFVVYEEDIELIATMHKVVKERHEEMNKIEKRMIELEQVLFQMYEMVQEKLVILVNEQQPGDDDDHQKGSEKKMMKIYDSVENLVGTIEEAYHRREQIKLDRTSLRALLMTMMLSLFMGFLVFLFKYRYIV